MAPNALLPMLRTLVYLQSWHVQTLSMGTFLSHLFIAFAKRNARSLAINNKSRNTTSAFTNAPHAGVFTVMARTNTDIKGAGGISAFIVDSQPSTPPMSAEAGMRQFSKITSQVWAPFCPIFLSRFAGVFTVMARTNTDIKGAGGISAFIVDSQTPGISLFHGRFKTNTFYTTNER
jgi:hypothetical protein